MDESREIAGLGPSLGRARAYSFAYLWWDGLKVVADQILTNVLLAWLGVFVICVILLGSVPAALYVLLSLICINIEVCGSYWWMGESINYVSGIFLVRRVGDCFHSIQASQPRCLEILKWTPPPPSECACNIRFRGNSLYNGHPARSSS